MVGPASSVADRLIFQLAERTEKAPEDLPRLYDRVDPDALETLIDQMDDGMVRFDYAGYEIIIESTGAIRFDQLQPASERAGTADKTPD